MDDEQRRWWTRVLTSTVTFLVLTAAARNVAGADGMSPPKDPFAYCSAVGDIDVPAGGASPVPATLNPYLAKAIGLTVDPAAASAGYYWRCMSGAVYVCAVGANIPCSGKANWAKHNLGAEQYCLDNPRAGSVPAYATGHETIYRWRCSGGAAVRETRHLKVDQRGFRADLWHRVTRE